MISSFHMRSWTKTRGFAYALATLVLVTFVAANAHLIFVSFGSKPECVILSEKKGAPIYRAAKPSC